MTPHPGTGLVFGGWTGDASDIIASCPDQSGNCTFSISRDRSIIATFVQPLLQVEPTAGAEINPAYMIYKNPPKSGPFDTSSKKVTLGVTSVDPSVTSIHLTVVDWAGLDKIAQANGCSASTAVFTDPAQIAGGFTPGQFYLNFTSRCQPNQNLSSPYAAVDPKYGDYRPIKIRATGQYTLPDLSLGTVESETTVFFRLIDPIDRPAGS